MKVGLSREMAQSPSTWALRDSTEDDMAGILECWRDAFVQEGVEPMSREVWRWKFVENPLGAGRCFVAEDHGRIVGYYGTIRQSFWIDGREVPGALVVDVLTPPAYQRQGMFTKLGGYSLARCASDGSIAFATGFPIRPAVIPGHLRVGWSRMFSIGTWVQPLALGEVIDSKFPLLGRHPRVATLIGKIGCQALAAHATLCLAGRKSCRVIRETSANPDRLIPFLLMLRAELPVGSCMQARSLETFAWRYDRNPAASYRYHLALDSHGHVAGLAIVREATLLGVKSSVIADLLVRPRDPLRRAVLRALLVDVRQSAVERESSLVAMMLSCPNPILPSPWAFGFVPAPYRFTFITKVLDADRVGLRQGLAWHLMWGDSDDV